MIDEAAWRIMATGLVAVRDAVRKQYGGRTRGVERTALAKVADSAAFAGLGPALAADLPPADRGRWIVGRVRQRLLDLERAADMSPSGRAVRCWARYVDEGLSPAELHAAHADLIVNETPARTDVARRNRVQSLMWAGGARGDRDSLPGVLMLGAELRTALSIDLPDGTRMDATTFGYEWQRLVKALPGSQDLMQALARLAPDHAFPLALLRDAGDSLPGMAEVICASPERLRTTCAALQERGLLRRDGVNVMVPSGVSGHVTDQVSAQRGVHWDAAVLRFLTHALRADTHHSQSWPEWELGLPHVLALCEAAERHGVSLGDVAYLLDRASVYVREALEDAEQATALARHAADIAAGQDDHELTGTCLGNLAMAHRMAGRRDEAIRCSEEGLEYVAKAVGTDAEEYAESLTVHGAILAAGGRSTEATEAHARAVEIARTLYGTRRSDRVRGLLVGAINDYAAHLMATGERQQAARDLFAEANRLLRKGEYGWTQVRLNLARASRAAGDLDGARDDLEDLRTYCVENNLNPSNTLVAVLRELAEVYEELGDGRHAATLREAHRVDNALVEALDRPLRAGRSG